MATTYLDTSAPPLDLLRPRKKTILDQSTGREIIQRDLYCCGYQYQKTSSVNDHYRKCHTSQLPLSDPASWSHITIRDFKLHALRNVRIPFVPFPDAQKSDCTWTIQCAPRVAGNKEERAKRIKPKSNQEKEQVNSDRQYTNAQYLELVGKCLDLKTSLEQISVERDIIEASYRNQSQVVEDYEEMVRAGALDKVAFRNIKELLDENKRYLVGMENENDKLKKENSELRASVASLKRKLFYPL